MRIRIYCLLALLVSSLAFSGCFEIYYDVVQNVDGSFLLRQTVGFGHAFFEGMAEFASIGKDSVSDSTGSDSAESVSGDSAPASNASSTNVTAETILDSMRHSFAMHRDSLVAAGAVLGKAGITRFDIRDTTIDTMTYFTMEARVTNADSLPSALHIIAITQSVMPDANAQAGASAEPRPIDSDDVRLMVHHTQVGTMLMFFSPPKPGGYVQIDVPGMEDLFKGLSVHYRVFASAFAPTSDKAITHIPGGEERVFGLSDLTKKGRDAKLHATFVIKNAAKRR